MATRHITPLPRKKPKTKKEILAFLEGHGRYHTANSWNRGTSYSVCIKISHLNLTEEERSACYDMLACDDAHDESGFIDILNQFDRDHGHDWQIGTNGRSGGYCVLYAGGRKPSGYKSRCPHCGQQNCEPSTPASDVCGRCHQRGRVNYATTHTVAYTRCTSVGDDVDDTWDLPRLKALFDVVWEFDKAVEDACRAYVGYAMANTVQEETVMVPKKVMVARPKD